MYPDSPTRTKVDLAGSWEYSLDGKEWNAVSVPSAYDFTGKVTLSRTFQITSEMLDAYAFTLVCYGINNQSEISINGNFVARHLGGYATFTVPIAPNILQLGSQNTIKISVDNELTPTTTLPLRQQPGGWRSYGGIFRDIYLLGTPKLSVDEVNVNTELTRDAKQAKVPVQVTVSDRGSGLQLEPGTLLGVQVEAFDKLTNEPAGRSGIVQVHVQPNKSDVYPVDVVLPSPKLWFPSPDTSNLYVFKCQLVKVANKEVTVLDEFSLDVGLRQLQWKDGKLLVNGRAVPLKGVLWYEDHATFASSMTYEALERDVASIKSIGANLIRFPYPPHPYMLNLCDRYGLLVMEDIPLVNVPEEILTQEYYQDLAATYAKEMVARDKNHVSVLAWGIGDDFETRTAMACEYVNALRNIVHAMDPRPVYFATSSLESPCFENIDMIAINAATPDARKFRDELRQLQGSFPEKPLVVARFGRDVMPGNRAGYSDPLSMEAQARSAMVFYEAIKDARIAGGVLSAFADWRSDRPSVTSHAPDPYLRAQGIVSYERERRPAFDVVRSLYNGEKVQALPVGNYSPTAPMVYVLSGLVALLSLAFVYNGNRRFREAVNRSLFRTYNFFADVRDQRLLAYSHTLFLGFIVSLTWATLLSSLLTFYRDSALIDNVMSQVMSDGAKEWVVRLIRNPAECILIVTGLLCLKLLLVSVLIRILSMMVRTKVYFYHSFVVTMWALLPYIILIPIVMILYRLLDDPVYLYGVLIMVGLLTLWVLFRLLKGISIIYDVHPLKIYAIGVLVLLLSGSALYGYVDYTRSASLYVRYLMRTAPR